MRKIINYILPFTLVLCLGSCENFLDVNPKGEVLRDELLSTPQGVENAMYGVYATMRKNELYGRNLSHYALDIMAQYYTSPGNDTVTLLQAYDYKNSKVEALFYDIWCAMYNNISNANSILDALNSQSGQSMQYGQIYKGESLGLRAFMHFDLLRIFCKQTNAQSDADGIPYATDFSLRAPQPLKLQQVYTHIIADLKEAETLLTDEDQYVYQTSGDKFLLDKSTHFNLNAVRATLARVYLTRGQNDSALIYAEKVIGSGKYELAQKTELEGLVAGIHSKKETIFGIYSKKYYDVVNDDLYRSISFHSLDPRFDIDKIYSKDVGKDYRWDAYFYSLNKKPRVKKLSDTYRLNGQESSRPESLITGINLIRLPEMYHIAAEAALTIDAAKALYYFNEILKSRGLTPLDERIPAEGVTIGKIDDDRYKELLGEGQAFYNLKRRNLSFKDANGKEIAASDKIYVVSIPEQEFDYRK